MPRYGDNLQSLLKHNKYDISEASMFQIGLNILNILELVHDSGYVYNDLKFENILLGNCQSVPDEKTADTTKDNLLVA